VKLFDVNVLVYAFRQDAERHAEYHKWLLDVMADDTAFAISEQVLAAVLRLTTHPKIFKQPSRAADVFTFAGSLLGHASCRVVRPSGGHWTLFQSLCTKAQAKGNLVTDAWFAALAMDSGCTWITTDRDYARFPGLRWRHPLDHERDIENPA
jgi:toxin-antitoxin system PIN domain toxin